MVSQAGRVTAVRRAAAVLAATAAVATGGGAFATAAVAAATPVAAPHCTIDFTTSTETPAVGQDITLRWRTTGADLLVASWTTAPLPFTGTQVTTRTVAGPASYQVTGLKSGQYCGGGVVNVVYQAAAAVTSSAAASSSVPSSPTAPSSGVTASTTPRSSSTSVAFPAQSPTGGSGLPWWQQPTDLAVIGVLSLVAAAGVMRRERLRAVFARRH